MNVQELASFLGWCTVINFGVLIFSTIFLVTFGGFAVRIHEKMFKVEPKKLNVTYFNYLSYYKMGVLIFNLTPYIALKIMA